MDGKMWSYIVKRDRKMVRWLADNKLKPKSWTPEHELRLRLQVIPWALLHKKEFCERLCLYRVCVWLITGMSRQYSGECECAGGESCWGFVCVSLPWCTLGSGVLFKYHAFTVIWNQHTYSFIFSLMENIQIPHDWSMHSL